MENLEDIDDIDDVESTEEQGEEESAELELTQEQKEKLAKESKEKFPPWKKIIPDPEVTSAKIAIQKFQKDGYDIEESVKKMLTKVNWKEKLNDSYEIVSLSVDSLFQDDDMHTYKEIKDEAKYFGLDLVPAKLAPSICLNYEKSGEHTIIAMKAIHDDTGKLKLFDCEDTASGPFLNENNGDDEEEWYPSDRFFFVRK